MGGGGTKGIEGSNPSSKRWILETPATGTWKWKWHTPKKNKLIIVVLLWRWSDCVPQCEDVINIEPLNPKLTRSKCWHTLHKHIIMLKNLPHYDSFVESQLAVRNLLTTLYQRHYCCCICNFRSGTSIWVVGSLRIHVYMENCRMYCGTAPAPPKGENLLLCIGVWNGQWLLYLLNQ